MQDLWIVIFCGVGLRGALAILAIFMPVTSFDFLQKKN